MSNWDEEFCYGVRKMQYPAVIKMKYYIRKPPGKLRFNRKSVFRRDLFTCQYCGEIDNYSNLTIDHIKPQCSGGISSWLNCATSCIECNARKGSKSLEESGMRLARKPYEPTAINGLINDYMFSSPKHEEWDYFFQGLIGHGKYLK